MNLAEQHRLKETILQEYPRLGRDDSFSFACGPGVSCFTVCCADVTIALTPYDILRLKQALGISSQEFLSRYTLIPFDQDSRVPVVILRMAENEKKSCPFVGPQGCSVYSDRPWACRMYPIGLASPAKDSPALGARLPSHSVARVPSPADAQEEFFFLLKEEPCAGHESQRSMTIRQWLSEQGIDEYNALGELFKEISLHPRLLKGQNLDPGQMEMFYLACYNLDKFRQFVFESSFLKRFQIEPGLEAKLRDDDLELMKFGFRWLRFALFGEPTVELKPEAQRWAETQLRGVIPTGSRGAINRAPTSAPSTKNGVSQ